MPAETCVPDPSVPPVLTVVIVNVSPSASVSLSSTTSLEPFETVNVAFSLTLPVSLLATGAAFVPVTVIVKVAVSVS